MSQRSSNNKHIIPWWVWLASVAGCIIIIFAFYRWAPEEYKNLFELVSLLGTYITLIGFVIALVQIHSLRTVSESTEKAIAETRNDLKRVSTVADISKQLEVIRHIKDYVKQDKYDIAQLRLYELKDFLTAMEQEKGLQIDKEQLKGVLKNAKNQLAAIDNRLNNNVDIKKEVFTRAMEEIASVLVGIKANL